MLSFLPLSTTPYSSLASGPIYAFALFSSDINLELSPAIKFYESIQFDCFSNFIGSLDPVRQINVYHIMYVTTNKNNIMLLNTEDLEIVYHTSDFYADFYVDTDLNYELPLIMSADFILNAIEEY
jgi:hypothetical protein